jgi:hypothetical protein
VTYGKKCRPHLRVDLILDAGSCTHGIESTVVDLTPSRPSRGRDQPRGAPRGRRVIQTELRVEHIPIDKLDVLAASLGSA